MSARVIPPSKVLHASNVAGDGAIDELVAYMSAFGKVEFVCLLAKQQALIEMDSIQAATAVLVFCQTQGIVCRGHAVALSFSHSDHLNRAHHTSVRAVQAGPYNVVTIANANANASNASNAAAAANAATASASAPPRVSARGGGDGGHSPPAKSSVLLLTILNPLYNISCDVLHQIMSPFGNVLRIVVFMKNGVQAMVEFDSAASASMAQRALDGRDIYAGSCTLKIVFSRAQTLNVKHNDERSRDFTRPDLPPAPPALPPAVVPSMAHAAALHGMQLLVNGSGDAVVVGGGAAASAAASAAAAGANRVVVAAHNVRADLTLDQVFNIFGNFGNVVRIKQLAQKPTARLVQFADALSAEAAVRLLHDVPLFDAKLDVKFSQHPAIAPSQAEDAALAAAVAAAAAAAAAADPLAAAAAAAASAASLTFKDYTASPLNRFRRQVHAPSKNMSAPNETLHFTNLPPEATDASCLALLAARGAPPPLRLLFFDAAAGAAQRSGLIEFHNVADAMSALVHCNNVVLTAALTFKLSFTSNHIKLPYDTAAAATAADSPRPAELSATPAATPAAAAAPPPASD